MKPDKTKRSNRTVYNILWMLLVVVVVLVFMNRSDSELRRALEENREFHIRIDGRYTATVNLQTLLDLEPEEFTTPFATSVTAPRDTTLKGVELRLLLAAHGIDVSSAAHVVASGLDGYYSPVSVDDVLKEGVVYICYSMDGEIMKTQSEGGVGPFMMVIRGARFAQRWCKYVEAIDLISS